MVLFNKKVSSVIGVDFGSQATKIVQLKNFNGQAQLVTYGLAAHELINIKYGLSQSQNKFIKNLQELIRHAKITTNRAIAALPAPSAFSTIIELPEMSKKEIASAIQWEAKKIIPLPLEKVSLAWDVIQIQLDKKKKNKILKVIITAAPKDIISNYLAIFQQVDLELIGLETEITALRRSLLPSNKDNYLIVDIGIINTHIIIFSNNIPVITRNVDIGGRTIDINIANTMNIQNERAEQFRSDFGLPAGEQTIHPVSKAIQFVFDNMIIKEVKKVLSNFQGTENGPINQIILTGGYSRIKNITNYFEKVLHIKTVPGQPWRKVSYPVELKEELEKIGPQMAVAIGLALKDIK